MNKLIEINKQLIQQLISAQFPQWKNLPISPVAQSGWDNRTFHLGNNMLVRIPSAADYELQVEKEQQWLPKLAPHLPLSIPKPIAMGKPGNGYPWKWSIYEWIEGETLASAALSNLNDIAKNLAEFLLIFHTIETAGGPEPGLHSFYRGGDLSVYDSETRQAIGQLKSIIDSELATEIWDKALTSHWQNKPVWVHGDLSIGNLLVQNGDLTAVIDFGQLNVGDPACDLVPAWTLFKDENRDMFRRILALDEDTWCRGRAWTLWKTLITLAGIADTNATEVQKSYSILNEVFSDYKANK